MNSHIPKLNTSFLAASCTFIKQLHYHLVEMEKRAGHEQLCNVRGKPTQMGPQKLVRTEVSRAAGKDRAPWKKKY